MEIKYHPETGRAINRTRRNKNLREMFGVEEKCRACTQIESITLIITKINLLIQVLPEMKSPITFGTRTWVRASLESPCFYIHLLSSGGDEQDPIGWQWRITENSTTGPLKKASPSVSECRLDRNCRSDPDPSTILRKNTVRTLRCCHMLF